MYPQEWLIGVGLGALLIGTLIGFVLRQFAFGGARKERDLRSALESTQEELTDYRQQVYDEYEETARKFKTLTESYDDLHRHLANSAMTLVGDAAGPLLEAPDRVVREESETDDGADGVDEMGAAAELVAEDVVAEPLAEADIVTEPIVGEHGANSPDNNEAPRDETATAPDEPTVTDVAGADQAAADATREVGSDGAEELSRDAAADGEPLAPSRQSGTS